MHTINQNDPPVLDYLEEFSSKLDCVMVEIANVKRFALADNLKLYNVNQLARALGLAPGTIYNKINKRQIPFMKIGGSIRFSEEHLNQILYANSK